MGQSGPDGLLSLHRLGYIWSFLHFVFLRRSSISHCLALGHENTNESFDYRLSHEYQLSNPFAKSRLRRRQSISVSPSPLRR